MQNPFADQYDGDSADRELVALALKGDGDALNELCRRHQGFIYGIAVRMVWDPRDAEDATQEILIKIVTGLSSFRGDSAFRTWAYRIAINHVLNWRRGRVEKVVTGFDFFSKKIDALPDLELSSEFGDEAERRILTAETRGACLMGMLLCLDREQRLTFVLGEIFGISDGLGSEILGITRQNYRQRLGRSRQQLYAFMRGKCGLASPANPCRCARKTRGAIRAGIVDPKTMKFVPAQVAMVKQVAGEHSGNLAHVVKAGYAHLYRGQGIKEPADLAARLREILANQRFRAALNLGEPS
jgi:RNA polymerase sigma factor (sigma-70 family)